MLCIVLVNELRKPQRTGHPRRPAADDDDIRFHLRTLDVWQRLSEVDHALAFLISSISGGTISNKLPTTPKSAISNIGASASLLMAMIVRAPFIPTMCWMAPLMPSAR